MATSTKLKGGYLAFLLFLPAGSLACTRNQSGEKPTSAAPSPVPRKDKAKSNKTSKDEAINLVLKNYDKVFSSLFLHSDLDNEYFHPPKMHASELSINPATPSTWTVSYSPEAGFYFEARVDRRSGFVEWVDIGFASE